MKIMKICLFIYNIVINSFFHKKNVFAFFLGIVFEIVKKEIFQTNVKITNNEEMTILLSTFISNMRFYFVT